MNKLNEGAKNIFEKIKLGFHFIQLSDNCTNITNINPCSMKMCRDIQMRQNSCHTLGSQLEREKRGKGRGVIFDQPTMGDDDG